MLITRAEFDKRLADGTLSLTFIGMSGIGKTHRARQLSEQEFTHICCDDLIAASVASSVALKDVADVGNWMGQPYTDGYATREKEYLRLENQATLEALVPQKSNTIIDTTGSVIYLPRKTHDKLKKQTLVIYLEANESVYDQMREVYLDNPKPVIWGDVFAMKSGEGPIDALKRCYTLLLKTRSKRYEKLADISISYERNRADWWDGQVILEAIREQLPTTKTPGGKASTQTAGELAKPKVLKFGGTSMGSAKTMRHVMNIITAPKQDPIAAVVVSAMGGVTDSLISLAQTAAKRDESYKKDLYTLKKRHRDTVQMLVKGSAQKSALARVDALLASLDDLLRGAWLFGELPASVLDRIMSHGERLSATILTDALKARRHACEYLDASTVIVTDDAFGSATVDYTKTNQRVRAHMAQHSKPQIMTGFIAATPTGAITTLGRGGSDYTAAIVGAAIDASSIEIWTDVTGVFTADPRIVDGVLPVSMMTYEEASEVSYFGAKVIHPPTMLPARKKGIPLVIKNTFDPSATGTTISAVSNGVRAYNGREALIKAVTSLKSVSMLTIQGSGLIGTRGAASRFFTALTRAKVNVILITQASSEYSISVAIDSKDSEIARAVVDEEFTIERQSYRVEPAIIEHDLAIVAIVGERMRRRSGVAGKLFGTLGAHGVNVVATAQGSSELNVSVVVRKDDTARAVRAIHDTFFYPEIQPVHVFLVGAGLIGGTLLSQIAAAQEKLLSEGYRITVAGIADIEHMVINPDGINLRTWEKALQSGADKMDLEQFIVRMKECKVPNAVFVDCTASSTIAAKYVDVLDLGISIVTPNKKANSTTYAYYQHLREAARASGALFCYETNVGAGLPVIGPLRGMVTTGDTVRNIEAVLSGTLSHVFNTYDGTKPFSTVIREARKSGYTEPDPRDDLSGMDVARKILILARETGVPLELSDIQVESLVSKKAQAAKSVGTFFKVLATEDAGFAKRLADARKQNARLRYVAVFEKGKAVVALRAVQQGHPFYELSGSDNIVAITTKRYTNPLVVKGAGAGAEVTAAGVFADILKAVR